MDRSSRTGAALWLGGLAALTVALVATVQLGPGIASLPPEGADDRTLEYYLGPDGLGIDAEALLLSFRRGKVTRVEVIED